MLDAGHCGLRIQAMPDDDKSHRWALLMYEIHEIQAEGEGERVAQNSDQSPSFPGNHPCALRRIEAGTHTDLGKGRDSFAQGLADKRVGVYDHDPNVFAC